MTQSGLVRTRDHIGTPSLSSLVVLSHIWVTSYEAKASSCTNFTLVNSDMLIQ